MEMWRRMKSLLDKVDTRSLAIQNDFDIAVAFIQNPEDAASALALVRMFVDRGLPFSDALQERLLRVEIVAYPTRLDLMRSLIALLVRQDRPLLPDIAPAPADEAEPEEKLVAAARAAGEAEDVISLYAGLWQAVLQHPGSARGWAELAAAFADRRRWPDTCAALKRAMAPGLVCDDEAIRAALHALSTLAEQNELKGLDWQPWFLALPEALQAESRGVNLLFQTQHPKAAELAPMLIARAGEGDVKALLVGAVVAAFEQGRFEEANGLVRRAFELDLSVTLREMVYNYSGQITQIVRSAQKREEMGAWLEETIPEAADFTLIPASPAPEVMSVARRLRAEAIERGLPSPVLVTHGKSASVSVANIFNSGFGLPTAVYSFAAQRVIRPWLKDYLRGGACYTTHLEPSEINLARLAEGGPQQRVIVHVRDPRQLVVSLMEHYRRYPAQLTAGERREMAGDEAALDFLVDQHMPRIVAWIDDWVKARDQLDVRFTTFEEFVTDRERFLERILSFYGGDTRYFNRAAALGEQAGTDYHRRSGRTDEWKERLTAGQIATINRAMPDYFWDLFGWTP